MVDLSRNVGRLSRVRSHHLADISCTNPPQPNPFRVPVPKDQNNLLMDSAAGLVAEAQRRHARTGCRQKLFGSFRYAAASWDRERRVIVKAEHNAKGPNTRFVVTSLALTDRHLYSKVYCARGDMENRIKNQQLDLFADRASCTGFWSNQFRHLLSGLAYTLIEALRGMALANTRLAVASPNTIRLTLLRIGTVVAPHPPAHEFRLSAPGAVPTGRAAPRLVLTANSAAPARVYTIGGGGRARRTRNTRIRAFPHPKTRRETPNSPRSPS